MVNNSVNTWHTRCIVFLFCIFFSLSALSSNTVTRIGIDRPRIDVLDLLIAVEKLKQEGEEIRVHYMYSENTLISSTKAGLVDIAMGAPYVEISEDKLPARMFFQLQKLRFYPVVNNSVYKNWNDLDGATVYVHGPSSGTEAIMNHMAKLHNISYKEIKFLPGSRERMKALQRGMIDVTIVDAKRKNALLNSSDMYSALPIPEFSATDEALFASNRFLNSSPAMINRFVKSLLEVRKEVKKDPHYLIKMRDQFNLLPKLKQNEIDSIIPHYQQLIDSTAYSIDGGSKTSVEQDIEFYLPDAADNKEIDLNDYWDFSALDSIR